MPVKYSRRHLLWIVPVAALAIGSVGLGARMLAPPPSDLDLSLSKRTDKGLYVATLAPISRRSRSEPCTAGP